jgi:hypothetical protein
MERVLQKSRSFKQAEKWDIFQHISMTPEQRQEAAAQIRERIYGKSVLDVREAHKKR